MTTKNYSDERRTFLKTVAALSGITACVAGVKESAAADEAPLPSPEKNSQGYRETEHISRYYQTARN